MILAGFGFPISEDVTIIYATLTSLVQAVPKKKFFVTVFALWSGVVISDIITFCIGRSVGVSADSLGNLGNSLGDNKSAGEGGKIEGKDVGEGEGKVMQASPPAAGNMPSPPKPKLPPFLRNNAKYHRYLGFIIRFCVGFRSPLMLYAGWGTKITLKQFSFGTALGACGSLLLQIYAGFALFNLA